MARKYTYYNQDLNVAVRATTNQFERELQDRGFTRFEEEDLPEGAVEAEDLETAVAVADNGVTADEIQHGPDESESDDGSGSAREGDVDQAAEGGGEVSQGAEAGDSAVESDAGEAENLAPDPNGYRETDDQGFVNNRAAGGAVPGSGGARDFVNGVDHEEPDSA